MKNVSIWVSAMRLRTLPLSISGIIVASSLAYYKGHFSISICVLALLTTISLQVLSNLANDYGDGVKGTDNEDRIGPERAIQSGAITPQSMLKAIKLNIFICCVLAFTLILTAFGVHNIMLIFIFFGLAIASVIAAMKYTMGTNAYGYKGLGDIFVFLFFGVVSVVGCYVLYVKTVHCIVIFPAITIGALSAAVLNLNNMRDIESDATAQKLTLAVKLGKKAAKAYHYTLIIGAIVASLLFGVTYYKTPLNLVYVLAYIPLGLHLKTVVKNKQPQLLDPELKKVALTTFLLALLLAFGNCFN